MSWTFRARIVAYFPVVLSLVVGLPSIGTAQLRPLTLQGGERRSEHNPLRATPSAFDESKRYLQDGPSAVTSASGGAMQMVRNQGVRLAGHTPAEPTMALRESRAWQLEPSLETQEWDQTVGSLESQLVRTSATIDWSGCQACGATRGCVCYPGGFLLDWTRAEVQAGVVGFTGPGNYITPGSTASGKLDGGFGFQQAFNFGTQLPSLVGGQLGSQFGMRFTQTSNHGNSASSENRKQLFLTSGLFRRVDYGVQGGLVVDYFRDDWIYQADLLQLRGELSFVMSPCHVGGFRFTDSQKTRQVATNLTAPGIPSHIELSTLDTYRFFYRVHFGAAGRSRLELLTGFSGHSHGLLGVDLRTPLRNQLGLNVTTTYLIPDSDMEPRFTAEGWNLGLNLVWTPGRSFGFDRDYYRPLVEVADNGTLFTRVH